MADILYEDRLWKIMKEEADLPDGRVRVLNRVYARDSVHIIAFTGKEKILLLREFRAFYGKWVWMLPSGKADKENDLRTAAQRELQEETGFRAKILKPYFSMRHSENVVLTNHVFLAEGLEPAPLQQDEHELIEVHEIPFKEALEKALQGSSIEHTPTAFALLRYAVESALIGSDRQGIV
jgi:ADP-ribose pyrophosphatase